MRYSIINMLVLANLLAAIGYFFWALYDWVLTRDFIVKRAEKPYLAVIVRRGTIIKLLGFNSRKSALTCARIGVTVMKLLKPLTFYAAGVHLSKESKRGI